MNAWKNIRVDFRINGKHEALAGEFYGLDLYVKEV